MALTDSQQSARDSFGRLSIRNRRDMNAVGNALCICSSTHPLAQHWLAKWGRSAVGSSEEHALIKDIHERAQYGDSNALAVVKLTIQTITINRIKS